MWGEQGAALGWVVKPDAVAVCADRVPAVDLGKVGVAGPPVAEPSVLGTAVDLAEGAGFHEKIYVRRWTYLL